MTTGGELGATPSFVVVISSQRIAGAEAEALRAPGIQPMHFFREFTRGETPYAIVVWVEYDRY
jgi:hypothetical protein